MEAYTGFAEVYDLFMDNIPYEEWGTYVKGLLKEYGVDEGLVLELGCGTGIMSGDSGIGRLRYDRYRPVRGDAGGSTGEKAGVRP